MRKNLRGLEFETEARNLSDLKSRTEASLYLFDGVTQNRYVIVILDFLGREMVCLAAAGDYFDDLPTNGVRGPMFTSKAYTITIIP